MVSRSLTIYFSYFAQFLKGRMSYRWDFFASIVSSMLVTGSGLLFVILLLDGKEIPNLNGWSREEVLFIYGYSMIATSIFSTFAINLYSFGDRYVIQGQFDRVLLRPLNSAFQVLFESFNLDTLGGLLLGLGILGYSAQRLDIHFGFLDVLWILVSSVSGGIIILAFFTFLASLSFHFEDRVGIAPPFYNMLNFGRYPLPIFNNVIQFILRWLVPFSFVAFYPATHFFSRKGFELYCYGTPLVALVCVAIATVAWKIGVRHYASTGS